MEKLIFILILGYCIGYCVWEKDPSTDLDNYHIKGTSGCCYIDLTAPKTTTVFLYYSDLCKSPNGTHVKIQRSTMDTSTDTICNTSTNIVDKTHSIDKGGCKIIYKHNDGTIYYTVNLKHDICGDTTSGNFYLRNRLL